MVKIDRHKDATVYVVWVLWLIGMSERAVGLVVGLGRKQVAGIISRSPTTIAAQTAKATIRR